MASAILVADTISEIMKMMSSSHISTLNITKNINQHLTALKEKCPTPTKLNLEDHETKKWVQEVTKVVTDLFYLVDDLAADAALPPNWRKKITSTFSGCNLTPLEQLKQMERRLSEVANESSLNKVKMLQNQEEETPDEDDHPSWRLKQCYDYCSFIFYALDSIEPEAMVRLWMAEGFLGPIINSSPEQPEELGHQCIKELLQKKILREDEDGEISLKSSNSKSDPVASKVGHHNLYIEELPLKDMSDMVQRVAIDSSKRIPKSLLDGPHLKLRSFFLPLYIGTGNPLVPRLEMLNRTACKSIFSTFKQLRVLTLKRLGMRILPASIGRLKSLRYLDLSYNKIKKLPHSILKLKHLQTLLLSHCYDLQKLPHDIDHFPCLRHLHVDHCLKLVSMPSALRKLTWLRTLPHFVAGTRNGLEQLLYLNNLRGDLEISRLERFKFNTSSKLGVLKEKQHLRGLTIRWNCGQSTPAEEQLVSQLEPHPNLQRLSVMHYKGNRFPDWLPSLVNLVEISLYYCSISQSLPSLHQFPNLENLTLMNLDSLQFVTNGDHGSMEVGLKYVKITDCPRLERWSKEEGTQNNVVFVFTSIAELILEHCPKLLQMPLFPDLEDKLVLDSSNLAPLLNTLTHLDKESDSSPLSELHEMTIINVDLTKCPRELELLRNLTSLEQLNIVDCKDLKLIRGWKHLSYLEQLHISNCTDIDLPSDEWEGLNWLETLIIEDIPDLENLPEGIQHLVSLNKLIIKNCPKLKTLTLPNLQFLELEDCPKLESLHQEAHQLILPKIRNCPMLKMEETADHGPQGENFPPPFPLNINN